MWLWELVKLMFSNKVEFTPHQSEGCCDEGTLLPLTPQDSVVIYRAKPPKHRAPLFPAVPQLLLFEVVATR